jgi:hypothetical protein
MRKYTLFSIILILLLALAACTGDRSAEPTPAATAVTDSPADAPGGELPPLPSLSGASGLAAGMGGGGGVAEGEPMAADTSIGIWDPLAEAELVLNVELPAEPQSAPVYEQPGGGLLTLDDVPRLAAAFGLSGPIYTERYPVSIEPIDWTPPTVYMVFDGRRQLAVADSYFYYLDETLAPGPEMTRPYGRAQQVAESYLRERGLLDFDYEMANTGGFDVEFRRLVDGRMVLYPEFMVAVNGDGQVWSVSYNPLSRLSSVGEYPLRPAAEAWQAVLDNGFDYQTTFFNIYPGPDYEEPVMEEPVDPGLYRYWERTFAEGALLSIYPYPTVYAPINSGEPPRINVDRYLLLAPAEQLAAIAEYAGKPIHLTGTYRTVDGRQAIELVSWEPLEIDNQWFFGEGTVRFEGELVLVDTLEGETLIIPDAPADLGDGERIYFNAWEKVAGDGPYPTINWQGMGILVEGPQMVEPMIEPAVFEPHVIKQVTVSGVSVVYAFVPVYDEMGQAPRFFVQPVWRFSGTADNGMIIDIFVQAAAGEYVSPGPAG